MNPKMKPLTALISWLALAPLALLSTDTAWSEVPGKTDARKTVTKKSSTKKTTAKKKSKSVKPLAGKAEPKKPSAPAQDGLALKPAPLLPAAALPAAVSSSPLPTPTAAPEAPAPVNPYLAAPSPNAWKIAPAAVPAAIPPVATTPSRNPYLAYLYAAPTPAPTAPTPWTAPWMQPGQPAVQAAAPTWFNPFLAIRPPVLPSQPWTPPGSLPAATAPVANAPVPATSAWVNPYLPRPQAQPAPVQAAASALPALVPSTWMPSFPALPAPTAAAPTPPANPAMAATPEPKSWTPPPLQYVPSSNPYLAYMRVPVTPQVPVNVPATPPVSANVPATPQVPVAVPLGQPIIVYQQASPPPASQPAAPVATAKAAPSPWDSIKLSVIGSIPPMDQAILPKITTVYPTGEKPLKVLTFKCPTELVGITPPTTALLHEAVNFAFDGINKANLLPFNMQQVCQ